MNAHEHLDKVKLIEYYLHKKKEGSQLSEKLQKPELMMPKVLSLPQLKAIKSWIKPR